MLIRYVNTASTVGTQDGTTNTAGSSGTAAFATLRQALDSLPSTLSDAYTIYCSGGEDTGNVSQTPWDFTTSATNYVLITTQGAQRHQGQWNESIYYLHANGTNVNGLYNNSSCHIRIDGLQVKMTCTGGSAIGIKTTNANQTASDIDMRVSNCIVKAVQSGGGHVTGYEVRPVDGSGTVSKNIIVNCMAIDCYYGFGGDVSTASFYNCGAYDCSYGFVADAAWTVKNCMAHGASVGFVGSFSGSSDYNVEDDGNGAPGSHPATDTVTFTFTNSGSDDFSLTSGDAGAKNQGTDLSGDGYFAFSTDITDGTRSGTWDIGPFEYGATSGASAAPLMSYLSRLRT